MADGQRGDWCIWQYPCGECCGGATFGGSGVVNGDVYNSGNIAMSHGGETGNTLTINGNYHGDNGSQININSQLGDDSSPTDKLVISGDTSGNTMVYVANVNGKGAQTKNGIEVIDVGGQPSGTFEQGNRVQIGLYEYRLYEDGGDWYLRSQSSVPPEPDDGDCSGTDDTPVTPQYRPDIGAYLGNQWMVRNLQMQTLYDREGSQYHNEDGSVWMRFKAGNAASQAADGNVDINNNYSQIQLGGDILTWGNGVQSLKAGGWRVTSMPTPTVPATGVRTVANSRQAVTSVATTSAYMPHGLPMRNIIAGCM